MKLLLLLGLSLVAACYAQERAGRCPADSGLAGICVFLPGINCLSDGECATGKKCCHEGCGSICKDIVKEVVHEGVCPKPTREFGFCVEVPNACTHDSSCAINEKCCPEGCNDICKVAVVEQTTLEPTLEDR